jgi:hypothetical protein
MPCYEPATDGAVQRAHSQSQPRSYTNSIYTDHHIYSSVSSIDEDPNRKNKRAIEPEDWLSTLYTLLWVDGWAAETLSCTLSVAALVCLMWALRCADGNVITDIPLNMPINTLVAVFAAVIKSSLLLSVAEGACLTRAVLWHHFEVISKSSKHEKLRFGLSHSPSTFRVRS